ncbi:MAG TPA: xanthine dehydrogenase family protein subunit M [Desulfobaccales bacterium]|nr:xanthine dehydrogenase family protein subunit M [Desulfobaccales bacterium]
MKEFEMIEPRTREEACQWLDRFKGKARPYAGGTDLLVELKAGRVKLDALVNLKSIRDLGKIRFSAKNGLAVGALATWTELLESEAVSSHYPLLRKACESMGSLQIRNVATLAGNICHASPAANGPIPLLLHEAVCLIQGINGARIIPVGKLFAGVQKNTLKHDEIVTEIRLPPPPAGAKGSFHKFAHRKAMELPVVAVGALCWTLNGAWSEVRLALGAVAKKPFRAQKTEKFLMKNKSDEKTLRLAAEVAAGECAPITDLRASKEYRLELVKELVFRTLKESLP